jgi:uncharacterized membrane protein (UPF0127 family)
MRTTLLALFALLACLWLPAACAAPNTSVTLHGRRFQVEVADTDAARKQGLMYRRHLDAGKGMLFIYPQPETFRFWMMNTLIPLDILFFDEQRRLLDVFLEAPPCKAEPCARYMSSVPAKYALELPAGTARRLGVMPGDLLVMEPRR